jgi:hypothetical protein
VKANSRNRNASPDNRETVDLVVIAGSNGKQDHPWPEEELAGNQWVQQRVNQWVQHWSETLDQHTEGPEKEPAN